jgi:hypothetical protein
MKDQPLQYDDVFFQQIHFVDEHRGTTREERCRFAEKRSSIFDTLHPNLFERLKFFYQTTAQQDFETLKIFERPQIFASEDRSV